MDRPYFVDDRHALFAGWIIGIGMRNGVDVRSVVDGDGNYTDRMQVPVGDQVIELVVPYPTDDWQLADG